METWKAYQPQPMWRSNVNPNTILLHYMINLCSSMFDVFWGTVWLWACGTIYNVQRSVSIGLLSNTNITLVCSIDALLWYWVPSVFTLYKLLCYANRKFCQYAAYCTQCVGTWQSMQGKEHRLNTPVAPQHIRCIGAVAFPLYHLGVYTGQDIRLSQSAWASPLEPFAWASPLG